MVFKAWDHQKTHQHIDFMLINGLIIIYNRLFKLKSFNLLCLWRQKSLFFCIFRLQNEKFSFFRLSLQRWDLAGELDRQIKKENPLNESSVGASCAKLWSFYWSIRISVPMLYITFLIFLEKLDNLGLRTELYANPLP